MDQRGDKGAERKCFMLRKEHEMNEDDFNNLCIPQKKQSCPCFKFIICSILFLNSVILLQ